MAALTPNFDGCGTPSATMPQPSDFGATRNHRNHAETGLKPGCNHRATIAGTRAATTATGVYRTPVRLRGRCSDHLRQDQRAPR